VQSDFPKTKKKGRWARDIGGPQITGLAVITGRGEWKGETIKLPRRYGPTGTERKGSPYQKDERPEPP